MEDIPVQGGTLSIDKTIVLTLYDIEPMVKPILPYKIKLISILKDARIHFIF